VKGQQVEHPVSLKSIQLQEGDSSKITVIGAGLDEK
jgi:hypothetical protein